MNTPALTQIAGQFGGIKIYCTRQAHAAYKQLAIKSKDANHWARLIVKGIQGLKNGIINNDDVFVHTTTMHRGIQDFIVTLPGCTVYAQREDQGHYIISKIVASMDYFTQQKKRQKPGLHYANKDDKKWETIFAKNGKVRDTRETNVVGISDRSSGGTEDTASLLAGRIKPTVYSARL